MNNIIKRVHHLSAAQAKYAIWSSEDTIYRYLHRGMKYRGHLFALHYSIATYWCSKVRST